MIMTKVLMLIIMIMPKVLTTSGDRSGMSVWNRVGAYLASTATHGQPVTMTIPSLRGTRRKNFLKIYQKKRQKCQGFHLQDLCCFAGEAICFFDGFSLCGACVCVFSIFHFVGSSVWGPSTLVNEQPRTFYGGVCAARHWSIERTK